MSRLDDLVKRWKEDVSRKESFQAEDLSELEQHLRDSVAGLRRSGLSDEESFLVASSRLGDVAALETEFRKVNGGSVWQRRVFWMLAGYVILQVLAVVLGGMGAVATSVAAFAGADGAMMASVSLLVTVLGWTCLFLWIAVLARHGDGPFLRQVQSMSPGLLVLILMGWGAAGTIMSLGGQIVAVRLAPVEVFGQAAYVSAIGNLVLRIAIPALCLVMIVFLRRGMRFAA